LEESIITAANDHKIPIENVDERLAQKISSTVSPSGVLALCSIPKKDISSIQKNENCIYLDCVRDPGNLGTIARTAVWFGVKHIVLSETCADPYNSKVVRSGMGAHFYSNFYSKISTSWLHQNTRKILVAEIGGKSINKFKSIAKPWVLVMGSEPKGVSEEILIENYQALSIPKVGYGESLNVAMAAGIILSSLNREKM
jgi:TrmH family RNA methyltransferase